MKRQKKFSFLFIVVALFCFLIIGKVSAQTTLVTVEGVVTDEDGRALPGVTVTVKNMGSGYEYSSTTQSNGYFVLSGIEAGQYESEVRLPGFVTQISRGMTFAVGAKLKIDFTLVVTTLEEEITVVAEAPMVEVTKSDISSVIDRQQIDALPLLDRDFADLAILKAGVLGGQSNAMPTGMGETMIDGISNENIIQNGSRRSPPADAIQEFRVMTNQFAAEYGNASGMVRTAITRSGTNEIKGRIAYFYRDEVLDSANYFLTHKEYKGEKLPEDEWEKSPFKHNNISAVLSGPIKKDKAHFFLAYEGLFQETYTVITTPLVDPYDPTSTQRSINRPSTTNQILAKLSFQPSEKHLLTLRFSHTYYTQKNGGAGGTRGISALTNSVRPGYEAQVNWTFFPSATSMNEFRAVYVIDDGNTDPLPEYAGTYYISRPSGSFGKATNLPQHNFADRYEFVDNFTVFAGDHTIKAGFNFIYAPSGVSVYDSMIPGGFYFNTDDPFDPLIEATYPYRFRYSSGGDPAFFLKPYQAAFFIQDSWRINPQLTINYGLRYNWFKLTGLDLDNGYRNLNPRFGFGWDPLGDGKTSVRGGIGWYTGNVMANIGHQVEFYKDLAQTTIEYPGYPDPFAPNPFRVGEEVPRVYSTYQMTKAPSPVSLQMTLGVQREVLTDFSVALDLIWTKGYNMITWDNENPRIPGAGGVYVDPTRGDVWNIKNFGKSDYKGLYLNFSKRYSRGWSLNVAYTLGRQMGNTERQDRPWTYEADCWDRAWGRKNRDARHKLTFTGIVDIPLGFQLGGIIYYRSKYPFNARYSYDLNGDGLTGDLADPNRNERVGMDEFFINARLSKYLNISRFRIQFFAEVYNVTNKTNFYNMYTYIDRPLFGKPTRARDPRLIQLGFRFNW